MPLRIDQLLAGFADGDAISHEALQIRNVLRQQGHASDIYADRKHTSPSMIEECLDAKTLKPGDVLIHHYSIGSPVLDQFAGAESKKVLIYHNITPAHYFRPYETRITRQLELARGILPGIAAGVDSVWADSEYNAAELRQMKVENVKVFPLLFDAASGSEPDDPVALSRLAGPLKTILSVGRIIPNKRLDVLLKAFFYYVKVINPYARLVIIGSPRSCPRYFDLLQMMTMDLDIPNVCFEGFAAPGSIATYYRHADLFVSASDHEGYCLPLVEAMHFNVPVLAHRIGGMPEAMDGAGVLYENADPAQIALLMDMILKRDDIRQNILSSQAERIQRIRERKVDEELKILLADLIGSR
ncbi:MAG TPA: glycosyltransferase [Kiritimatiellia bacterium]|nr:glycosyltransferase [Kiritimatiellia bacterium]